MSSRTWQMLAAAVSVALMIVVLLKYGLRDEAPPTTKPAISEPHAGAQHHTGSDDPIQHMGGQLAPIQVFAKAQVGDWIAYRVTTRSTLLPEEVGSVVLATITAVTDDEITIQYKARIETGGDRRDDWTYQRPRQTLTLDQLVDNDIAEWRIIDVKVTDEAHEVGGRSFACKQISYASIDPLFPSKRTRVTLWFSEEVSGLGLVEERETQDLETMHMEASKQLIGFGTATATTWGTKPDGF